MGDDVWSKAAARFRKPVSRWASPLDLAVALDPTYRRTPALELISKALVDVAERRTRRLAISMAPQEGKTAVLQAFILWLLEHRPEMRNGVVSYETDIATRSGRRIRDQIEQFDGADGTLDLGLRVRRGDHSAGRWSLDGHLGGLVCVGIGGALTGRSIDGVLVVDDAFKGHEEAMSSAIREKTWDWFRSTALTRLAPDAAVVLVGTRWHHQDLIGMVTKDAPGDWRVINIPAVADSPDDPLGRAEGEAIVSARGRTAEEFESTKRALGSYLWNALYQGRPSPVGGGVFKTDQLRYWSMGVSGAGQPELDLGGRRMPLSLCWVVGVADLAASMRTSADFTVIMAVAISPERDLIVLDMVRGRMAPSEHFKASRSMLERWRVSSLYIEQMMHSATLIRDATVAGVPISPLAADKDKLTRALPAAARIEQGRVWLPAGAPWLQDALDELAAFPAGAHDDIADCLAYSARLDSAHYLPPMSAVEEMELRRAHYRRTPEERALDEAFGVTPGAPDLDFFAVEF